MQIICTCINKDVIELKNKTLRLLTNMNFFPSEGGRVGKVDREQPLLPLMSLNFVDSGLYTMKVEFSFRYYQLMSKIVCH